MKNKPRFEKSTAFSCGLFDTLERCRPSQLHSIYEICKSKCCSADRITGEVLHISQLVVEQPVQYFIQNKTKIIDINGLISGQSRTLLFLSNLEVMQIGVNIRIQTFLPTTFIGTSVHDIIAAASPVSSVKGMRPDVIDIGFWVPNLGGTAGSSGTGRHNAELLNTLDQPNILNSMFGSSSVDTAAEVSGIFETMFSDQRHWPCNAHRMDVCLKNLFKRFSAAAMVVDTFLKMATYLTVKSNNG